MQDVVIFALFSVNWLKQLNEFHKLQNVEHTLIVPIFHLSKRSRIHVLNMLPENERIHFLKKYINQGYVILKNLFIVECATWFIWLVASGKTHFNVILFFIFLSIFPRKNSWKHHLYYSSRLYFFKLTWIRLFVRGGANGVVAAPLVFWNSD